MPIYGKRAFRAFKLTPGGQCSGYHPTLPRWGHGFDSRTAQDYFFNFHTFSPNILQIMTELTLTDANGWEKCLSTP